MGREVRRVPAGFDWPLNKVWHGFLMPDELDEEPCEACDHSGLTPARRWVAQISDLLLMLDEDLTAQERERPMHPYLNDTGTQAWNVRPSPDIAEFGTGLAGRARFMFHDAIDSFRATDKVIAAAGLDPKVWGICTVCEGEGSIEKYPGQRADAENWVRTDPPTGEWWQIWETTSEGSPITPPFATPEELAEHFGGGEGTLAWITDVGWAPSGIGGPGGFLTSEQIIHNGGIPHRSAS